MPSGVQRLTDPDDWVVTLNGAGRVDPDAVVARMRYEHPIYTPESLAAFRRTCEVASADVTAAVGDTCAGTRFLIHIDPPPNR